MRTVVTFGSLMLLALAACEEKRAPLTEPPVESTTAKDGAKEKEDAGQATTPTNALDASTVDASATSGPSDAGSADAGRAEMPERPIPRPQTMVRASMPIEVQQKAIVYMAAMRAPRPGDPNADATYADALAERLRPIALAIDTGSKKATMNKVEVIAGGRQIDLLMSAGCDDKTPVKAVVQRAATPLATLASHGVFVVRCNDAKVQCLQSTRDAQDVLCTTAPRHK